MLSLFRQKRKGQPAEDASVPLLNSPSGLLSPESAVELLSTPRRKKLLEHIWQRTSLSRRQFNQLYRGPLEHYAELVQQFPASESHHHAYHGGMLDHGLEIVAYALKMKQPHLLPVGSTPEEQSAQAEAWTAATAYAALLHDIGKIAVDLHVEYANGQRWHPWHGPLQQPYRFRYRKEREYRLHSAASGLLYMKVLTPETLDWLSDYPQLWAALLYVLAGQYEHAGILGELVTRADQASVAQALGGDPAKIMAAPKHALQRKLLDGLRYLLHEELKLNQPEASDGWLTDDGLWLVSKTVSDKLRAHLLAQGIDGIPTNNTAVFNVLQDHGIAQPTAEGKAIWKATVTSASGWSHSFTLMRVAPALIWEAGERPAAFSGAVVVEQPEQLCAVDRVVEMSEGRMASSEAKMPDTEDSDFQKITVQSSQKSTVAGAAGEVMNELLDMMSGGFPQDHSASAITQPVTTGPIVEKAFAPQDTADTAIASTVELSTAEQFMLWLRTGIQSRKLIINDARALIHTVADSVYLVSPGVFQRYAQEHPQIAVVARREGVADWKWVQKNFEKLQLHRQHDNGLNIWTCRVAGPRKTRKLHGYLMLKAAALLDEAPANNPYIELLDEADPGHDK